MINSTSQIDTALAHLSGGDTVKAEALLRQILAARPDHGGAWHGLACVARGLSKPRLAIAYAAQAIGLAHDDGEKARFHLTLALALDEAGHLREALSACRVALLLEPSDPLGHMIEANLLYRTGSPDKGAEAMDRAIDLVSDPVSLLQDHAGFLMAQGAFSDAVRRYQQLRLYRPEEPVIAANLGAALFESGAVAEAGTILDHAAALGDPSGGTLSNLGLAHLALGAFDRAGQALHRACELAPGEGKIINNLGTFYAETGKTELARGIFGALARGSDHTALQARYNLSLLDLADGDFARGWTGFEARRALLRSAQTEPDWHGEIISGPVRIYAEQGLGDSIQFLRFLPFAASRASLVLDLPETILSLLPLMPALQPFMQSGRIALEGAAIMALPLLSLPHVLGIEGVDRSPYLVCDGDRAQDRVGVFWSGNPLYRYDRRRSVSPQALAPVLAVPGYRFLCLQQIPGSTCPDTFEQVPDGTLAETAHAMAQCGLIIGVDTALAHLAGALGIEFWLLDRFGGDWRWRGPDWYEHVRLFRAAQAEPPEHSWSPVIDQMAKSLAGRVPTGRI